MHQRPENLLSNTPAHSEYSSLVSKCEGHMGLRMSRKCQCSVNQLKASRLSVLRNAFFIQSCPEHSIIRASPFWRRIRSCSKFVSVINCSTSSTTPTASTTSTSAKGWSLHSATCNLETLINSPPRYSDKCQCLLLSSSNWKISDDVGGPWDNFCKKMVNSPTRKWLRD